MIGRTLSGRLAPALLVLLLTAAACGGDDGDADGNEPVTGNLFANGGFEEQLAGPCTNGTLDCWFSISPPEFTVSADRANSGSHSALLSMRETAESPEARVYYLVQDLAPAELPEVISGNYFVENWVKGTELQYLQFAVILIGGGENLPPCPDGAACPNYQIRYPLAGIDQEPFRIDNAKFVFVGTEEPAQREWVHFERNLRQDFVDQWGAVPEGFTTMRVLFEVRYDGKTSGEGPLQADVYYDDLYLGPPH